MMKTKICTRCKKRKYLKFFYKDISAASGFRSLCKKCSNESHKKWRKSNPEKIKIFSNNWYIKNKKHAKELNKKWHKNNPNYKKQYYQANKKRIKSLILKNYYGLTLNRFNKIKRKQKNKCFICKRRFIKTPFVSFCRETNEVRGLLCRGCGIGLSWAAENKKKILKYLG